MIITPDAVRQHVAVESKSIDPVELAFDKQLLDAVTVLLLLFHIANETEPDKTICAWRDELYRM